MSESALARLTAALADRYRIERELGAGGMATVYLAHDLKHDRDVAIKVLHPELAAALGGERFLSEIKTTAKLQHPHILALLDSGDADGLLYYVMPYVTGETLRSRLDRERQLPIEDALRIAREVADALGAAHALGIIHRDIKPENILLQGGHAQVADFGIALAVQHAGGARMTQTGLSLGTPQYMSPEQAMGEKVIDLRADIYALGAVTYEMLVGDAPFTGSTVQTIVAKVLTEKPMAPSAIRDTIPLGVEQAVLRALSKLPADRFASAEAFTQALASTAGTATMTSAARSVPARSGVSRRTFAITATIAVLAIALAIAAQLPLRTASPQPFIAVPIADIRSAMSGRFTGNAVGISRAGDVAVYVATDTTGAPKLVVRSLSDGSVFMTPALGQAATFSPNGKTLAYYATRTIYLLPLPGGSPRSLKTTGRFGGSLAWTSDSTIVYSDDGRLVLARVDGSTPEVLASSGKPLVEYRQPHAAGPGRVLCIITNGPQQTDLAVLSVRDKRVIPLGISGTRPAWVEGGIVTFLKDGRLWGVDVDESTLKPRGTPRLIADASDSRQVTSYDVAPNGALVLFRGAASADNELVLVDRAGKARPVLRERRGYRWPRFSPDGHRITVGVEQTRLVADIWVADINAANLTRITADSSSIEPEWDPPGRSLLYVKRGRAGASILVRRNADGGAETTVLTRANAIFESKLTPDQRTLVWREDTPSDKRDILMAPLDSPNVVHPLRTGPFDDRGFSLSPDGRWLAYTSDETGTAEVYLCRVESNGSRWIVSRGGGSEPRWARTGELFYRRADSLFVTRVTLGAEPKVAPPSLVFAGGRYLSAAYEPLWDVSPDGRQFVMVRLSETATSPLLLMLNWVERWRGPAR